MSRIVELSPRAVWIFDSVLLSEIKKEVYHEILDVERVKQLHHIVGEDYVVGGEKK